MPRLAALRAGGCPRFTDRGLAHLPRLSPSLLLLQLGPLPLAGPGGFAALGALTALTALTVTDAPGGGAGLRLLAGLARLVDLDLTGCRVTAATVMVLSPLTRLAQLQM